MKKKDNLSEILKKEEAIHLTTYLEPIDLLNFGLTSKKYYCQVAPILTVLGLDFKVQQKNEQKGHKNNKNNQKKKEKAQKNQAVKSDEVEVDIDKMTIAKWSKMTSDKDLEKWKKIDKIEINNSYLQKKLESRTVIFYKNIETQQLMYLNRSIVDPTLNYNKGGFDDSLFRQNLYEELFEEGKLNEIDFSSKEALLNRQKKLLSNLENKKEEQKKNEQINYEEELIKTVRMKKIAIILCFGGSFSFGIFENGKCLLHKSDKKYVCRKKAGERQLNRDKQSGSGIQSMGSQIRREQEKLHQINVGQILQQNKSELQQCEVILLQAPGLNRLVVINENENLDGLQDRLRSVCITAKKANFTEIGALFEAVSKINLVKLKE